MRYNRLGQSGLVVSELCLGAMTFGNKPSGFFKHDLDQEGSTPAPAAITCCTRSTPA